MKDNTNEDVEKQVVFNKDLIVITCSHFNFRLHDEKGDKRGSKW